MNREIKLRIVVEKPPAGVDYALQKGHGNPYEPVQLQRSGNKDLTFEFAVSVRGEGALAVLGGPFAQGPSGGKFVYIDIGTYAGMKESPWGRRLKVPLTGITGAMIERVAKDGKSVLETRVQGTDKKGEPSCATVKPFKGWKVAPGKPG